MMNTSPLTAHSTTKDYAQFLLRWFVLHQGAVKFMLYLTTLVDSLTPLNHLNVSVGMIQPHYPLTISMWHFLMHVLYHQSGGIALLVRSVREHWFCSFQEVCSRYV